MFRRSSRERSSSHLEYRPEARMGDIEMTSSGDEVLIYDMRVHHIHHLNPMASQVWKHCDGERTIDQIVEELDIAPEAVLLSLQKLGDIDLIDGPLPEAVLEARSRRSFIKQAATAGILAPAAIASISAPAAASSHSCPPIPAGVACLEDCQCNGWVCHDIGEFGGYCGPP